MDRAKMLATALDDERMAQIKHDHQVLITNLCNSIRDQVMQAVMYAPATWDGHEYRQLLADLFAREVYSHVMRGKRKRDYNNERAVNQGIP